jgi:hypothetical protein
MATTLNQLYPDAVYPDKINASQNQAPEVNDGSKKFSVHPFLSSEFTPTNQVTSSEDVIEQQTSTAKSSDTEEPSLESHQEHNVEQQLEEEVPNNKEQESKDWYQIRAKSEEAKQAKREAEALARERDFYREQALKSQRQPEVQEDYRTDTEKHLYQQMEELRNQIARTSQETEKAKRQAAIAYAEQRLIQDYPDIKQVVSEENIHKLEIEYPHLYRAVISSNDVYEVGSAAYELICAKGIAQPKKNTLQKIAQTSNPNKDRPRSASTISPQSGPTPLHKAGTSMGNSISSDEEKKALWQEMVNCSRSKSVFV